MAIMNKCGMRNIGNLATAVHKLAQEKGWYDDEQTEDAFIERMCNNLHDEVSELHEAWRKGKLKAPGMEAVGLPVLTCLAEELADILIRVLDDAKHLGVDIEAAVRIKHDYNKTRPHRHGNKKS